MTRETSHAAHGRTETLPAGEFLGSKRPLRTRPGWQAYAAAYPPSVRYGMHDHERAALCMVRTGSYREVAGGRTVDASPGSIVQQPAGNRHADEHGDQPVELLIVEFEPDHLAEFGNGRPLLSERVLRSDASTMRIIAGLHRELAATDDAAFLACEALVLDALVMMARSATPRETGTPAWLGRVEDRLRDFTTPSASLGELATDAGVHPSHLSRVFRQHLGMSVGNYRRRAMVEEARSQIESSDRPLAEIAAAVGFSDQSHMTRLFSTTLGRSPGRYRRRSS